MIKLTETQEDALIEICNVGMSKAAKQLSILLNSAIAITVPKINLMEVESISTDPMFNQDQVLSSVYQELSKDINGRAVIIFQRDHARLLTHSVIGKSPKLSEKEVRACEQEAMLEIGNIMISTCVSAIVNMLSQEVSLTVPQYHEDKIDRLIKEHVRTVEKISDNVILLATRLESEIEDIPGILLLVLSSDSIDSLLEKLAKLLGN